MALPRGVTHVALTHGHDDHTGDAVAICKESGATLIAVFELAMHMAGLGVVKVDPGTVVSVQEPSPCKAGGHPARPYIIGAAIVGGAVAIAIIVSQNNNGNNNKPASP